jgi:hypothetical protein
LCHKEFQVIEAMKKAKEEESNFFLLWDKDEDEDAVRILSESEFLREESTAEKINRVSTWALLAL